MAITIDDREASIDMKEKKLHEELCLDFANTQDWHASLHPVETLYDYTDLLSWSRQQGILTDGEAQDLERSSGRRPVEAGRVYREALVLREAIYEIFVAYVHGKPIAGGDLATLNGAIKSAYHHLHLCVDEGAFTWDWAGEDGQFDRLLWPVAYSAASLLTTPRLLERVGQCADERGCGWLFLDMSKNHTRRWCDIKDCGNRAKQRRHYQRKKAP